MAFPNEWLTGATDAVDRSIDKLVKDFKRNPFVHRREHSLHVDLYRLLISQPELTGLYPIGETSYKTRLVHKEWPSTARASLRDSTPRRQSYDIGILSPPDLAKRAIDTKTFAKGLPPARIAIEMSLDYPKKHLEGDIKKFARDIDEAAEESWPPVAYLIHFTRVASRTTSDVRKLIESTAQAGKIKVVYAELSQNKPANEAWKIWKLGADALS